MSCFDLTHAPVPTTARAAATGPVSHVDPAWSRRIGAAFQARLLDNQEGANAGRHVFGKPCLSARWFQRRPLWHRHYSYPDCGDIDHGKSAPGPRGGWCDNHRRTRYSHFPPATLPETLDKFVGVHYIWVHLSALLVSRKASRVVQIHKR